ncbi:MAG: DUF4347 domain-containing protein [Planctomycetota bacterium]
MCPISLYDPDALKSSVRPDVVTGGNFAQLLSTSGSKKVDNLDAVIAQLEATRKENNKCVTHVHLVGHGTYPGFRIGQDYVTTAAQATALGQRMAGSLCRPCTVTLWNCALGADATGRGIAKALAAATGCAVAAAKCDIETEGNGSGWHWKKNDPLYDPTYGKMGGNGWYVVDATGAELPSGPSGASGPLDPNAR